MTSAPAIATPPTRGWTFGLGWSATAQLVGMVVKLASTLVLTRLLAPDAYALIGTALVVLTTLDWLSDFGVVPALLRDPRGGDPDRLLVGWWVNLGRGAGLSAVAAASAVPLALFYRQPELTGVLLALAARPLLGALRSPGVPLLRRHLDYRALFVDEIGQAVAGTAVSVAAALLLVGTVGGVWALVAGTLAGAIAGVGLSYWLCPVRPRWAWDQEIVAELARFGRPVFVNTLVMAAWLNLDRLLGARLLPLDQLGLYMVAGNLAAVAEAVVTRGLDVYFTLLARRPVGDARAAWHRAAAGRLVRWGSPLLVLAVVVAPLAVSVLYDPRYHAAGLLLAVMLARLVVRAAGQLDFQLLLAAGRVRPATAGYAVALAAQAALVPVLAAAYGPLGLAAAVGVSTAVAAGVQVGLADDLRGGFARLGVAAGWAGLGLAAAAAVAMG